MRPYHQGWSDAGPLSLRVWGTTPKPAWQGLWLLHFLNDNTQRGHALLLVTADTDFEATFPPIPQLRKETMRGTIPREPELRLGPSFSHCSPNPTRAQPLA